MVSNNLLSVKQVAYILKVHPLTIRRYITDERLKAVKVGGNIRVDENELQNFHKDINPSEKTKNRVFKPNKIAAKQFDVEDPLFHLMGRGASLKLS